MQSIAGSHDAGGALLDGGWRVYYQFSIVLIIRPNRDLAAVDRPYRPGSLSGCCERAAVRRACQAGHRQRNHGDRNDELPASFPRPASRTSAAYGRAPSRPSGVAVLNFAVAQSQPERAALRND